MADRILKSKKSGLVKSEAEVYQRAGSPSDVTPQSLGKLLVDSGEYEYADVTSSGEYLDPSKFAENFKTSTAAFTSNMLGAISDPAKAGASVIGLASPSGITLASGEVVGGPEARKALGQYAWNRVSNPLKAFYEDPVGVASDVGALTGVAGGLMRTAAKVPALSGMGRAGEIVSVVGDAIDPVTMPTKLFSVMANPLMEKAAVGAYQSALYKNHPPMPKKTIRPEEEMERVARFGLENRTPIRKAGLERARRMTRGIENEKQVIVSISSSAPAHINKIDDAFTKLKLDALKGRTPVTEIDKIGKQQRATYSQKFGAVYDKANNLLAGPFDSTVGVLSDLKENLNAKLADKKYFDAASPVGIKVDEFVRDAVRDTLNDILGPGYKKLNMDQHLAISLRDNVERRVVEMMASGGNKGSAYATAQGARAFTGNVSATGAAYIYDKIMTPIMSDLAIKIYNKDHTLAGKIFDFLRHSVSAETVLQRAMEMAGEPPTPPTPPSVTTGITVEDVKKNPYPAPR